MEDYSKEAIKAQMFVERKLLEEYVRKHRDTKGKKRLVKYLSEMINVLSQQIKDIDSIE